jgi:hypothetical protein
VNGPFLAQSGRSSGSHLKVIGSNPIPDLNLSIDGAVQLVSSTADFIMARDARRRRSKPPTRRLRCPSLDETAMGLAFYRSPNIEIAPQYCCRAIQNKNTNSYVIDITR